MVLWFVQLNDKSRVDQIPDSKALISFARRWI